MNSPDELVPVFRSRESWQVEIVRDVLVDHGVDCQISGGFQAGLTGVLEVQLLVRAADRAVAEQILAQLASDQNGEGVTGDEGDGEAGSDDGGGDD